MSTAPPELPAPPSAPAASLLPPLRAASAPPAPAPRRSPRLRLPLAARQAQPSPLLAHPFQPAGPACPRPGRRPSPSPGPRLMLPPLRVRFAVPLPKTLLCTAEIDDRRTPKMKP
ncbi:hypothetical protein BRADI_2g28781v3 [Brachypodium distachyon]|uniref:Uncharacterized protein n=1 Tax=Brachypodium distachyon TaxID=15368 RepID=A0A2K2DB63_BRADI|nr:hypothetical protein BRADI_2g28781v3 [Brachypodium distachyon]PNT71504.1 hypothetical protein BRADI_2g28781v3 [Brachypodium distachyon]PNT71506.1 hypothetical protein BRADI_2g28781v3 [Brachypodium distachyon]PNT71509.1 hypothetical protein BRADI_2g28781v3 [Brachypodium distachyon]